MGSAAFLPLTEMDAARVRGAVPLGTWEPWAWGDGYKAVWNTSLVPYLAARLDVMGFVRFHLHREAERRINTSPSSASALNAPLLVRGG